MLASQSLTAVGLLTLIVSCRPPGDVAAIVAACVVVVMLAVPRPALSTSGPYVNATTFWLSGVRDTLRKSGKAITTLSPAFHTRFTVMKPPDAVAETAWPLTETA